MSGTALNGFTAATKVLKWLRAGMLKTCPKPSTSMSCGECCRPRHTAVGFREIKQPMPIDINGFERRSGAQPDATGVGIFYNSSAGPDAAGSHRHGTGPLHPAAVRRRLPAATRTASAGHETLRRIEREADDFANEQPLDVWGCTAQR